MEDNYSEIIDDDVFTRTRQTRERFDQSDSAKKYNSTINWVACEERPLYFYLDTIYCYYQRAKEYFCDDINLKVKVNHFTTKMVYIDCSITLDGHTICFDFNRRLLLMQKNSVHIRRFIKKVESEILNYYSREKHYRNIWR